MLKYFIWETFFIAYKFRLLCKIYLLFTSLFLLRNSELNLSKVQLRFPIFVYTITIHLILQTAKLGLSTDPSLSLPSPGLSILFLKCSLNLCPHLISLALSLIKYFNSSLPRWLTTLSCYLKFPSPSNAYHVSQPIENLFTRPQNLLGDHVETPQHDSVALSTLNSPSSLPIWTLGVTCTSFGLP